LNQVGGHLFPGLVGRAAVKIPAPFTAHKDHDASQGLALIFRQEDKLRKNWN
jgi:hypothetical protein